MADTKTYTEDEHSAVLAQVAELTAKVAELTTATTESLVDAAVAAAKADLEAQISDLQSQLDAAVLEAQAAKDDRDTVVSFLEAEDAAATAAAEVAARKEDRITQVKEVASFPDDYLEANADRFAAMSDEEFATAIEDWKVIAPKKGEKKEAIPSTTAMTAARSSDTTTGVMAEVMNLRFNGIDVRNVR